MSAIRSFMVAEVRFMGPPYQSDELGYCVDVEIDVCVGGRKLCARQVRGLLRVYRKASGGARVVLARRDDGRRATFDVRMTMRSAFGFNFMLRSVPTTIAEHNMPNNRGTERQDSGQ